MGEYDIFFDEVEHRYLVDGQEVPSVTEILAPLHRSYGAVNQFTLEQAARRGTAVHEVLQLYDMTGEIDDAPFEVEGYINAYLEWENIYRPEWTGIEEIVFCKEGWFIGTLDRIGLLNGTENAIVDIKTSTPNRESYVSVCLQTTAYAMAYASQNGFKPDWESISRYGLFLMKDGKFRLIDCMEWEGQNHINAASAFARLLGVRKLVDSLLKAGGKE